MNTSENEKLMTENEVSEALGIKPRTLQCWRLLGQGPKPTKLSSKTIRYRVKDVRDWLDNVSDQPI